MEKLETQETQETQEIQEIQSRKIDVPEGAAWIIRRLEDAGYEAFAVGGCVRDACLGREPNDWDITTSAAPAQVKALFRKTVDTGLQHGTVTVIRSGIGYEVTTYRIDGDYEDGRHPKQVTFTSSLTEDLRRRDFTINAMAYSDRTGLVDAFGGLQDLQNGVIRCVGNASERFSEDALRILRAVRFAAQLDFTIEPETAAAAKELAPNLRKISAERIRVELQKTILSDHPERLREAYELGMTAVVLPELDEAMTLDQGESLTTGEHTLLSLRMVRPDPCLRWTMLFHNLGKTRCERQETSGAPLFPGHAAIGAKIADEVLERLKSDRQTQRLVHALTAMHSEDPGDDPAAIRKLASAAGRETFDLYLEIRRADIRAKDPEGQPEMLLRLDETCRVWQEIITRGDPLTLGELAVTGGDLITAGMKPGRQMGAVLGTLLNAVLEDPSKNEPEILLALAAELMRENDSQ